MVKFNQPLQGLTRPGKLGRGLQHQASFAAFCFPFPLTHRSPRPKPIRIFCLPFGFQFNAVHPKPIRIFCLSFGFQFNAVRPKPIRIFCLTFGIPFDAVRPKPIRIFCLSFGFPFSSSRRCSNRISLGIFFPSPRLCLSLHFSTMKNVFFLLFRRPAIE